jgi:tetratricopeptide (TPR) repeat protein
MDNTFSDQRRVLLCEHCGAPFEALPAGGSVQCRYCNAYSAIGQRDERPVFAGLPAQQPLPEPERLIRLRAQDGRPMLPPGSLLSLMPNGQLEAWKVAEAITVWQNTRRELRTSNDFEAAERLLFLTIVLSQHFFEQGDRERQRALFESALEVFSLPRHRQMMLCYLSRCACRAGDLDAAQRWLTQCDARSDDLAMDSSYRFSWAFIDTARGNFQGVIAALGAQFDQIPIQDALDGSACALRANALERLGNLPGATGELRTGFARNPMLRGAIEKFIEVHRAFALCPQSLEQARARQTRVAASAAAERAGGGRVFAWVFLTIGALELAVAAGLGAIELAPLLGFELFGGPPTSNDPMPFIGLLLGGMGILFFAVGLFAFILGRNARRLRVSGVRAQARVLALVPTSIRVNDVPVVKLQVSIEPPGRAPYTAESKMVMHGALLVRAIPGASVPVRVDPKKPNKFILELD